METRLPILKSFFLFVPLLLHSFMTKAQVTICTNHPITNNANNSVMFNVQNTNSFDIRVTDVSAMINTGAAGTYGWQLLYNPTAINSSGSTWTQGVVGSGLNGWVSGGTNTLVAPAHTAPITVISGMNIIVPAGATYGFALTLTSTTGTLMDYSALTTPGVNTFSSGGVNVLTGDNISWGAAALPATPANYPRGFRGCINWISTLTCTGTPNVTTASGPAGTCSGANINLTASGYSTGTGITYSWEFLNTLTSNWDPVPGATTPNFTIVGGITAPTDYRLKTTCSNGGASDISNTVSVTINSFYDCYCASNATATANSEVHNVTFAGIDNTSSCTTIAPGPGSMQNEYSNYRTTVTPAQVAQGGTFPFSVKVGSCSGYASTWTKIYIDLDQNGLFTDPGDLVYSSPSASTGVHFETGNIMIPPTAFLGTTGMRVVTVETTVASGVNPCGTYLYGETEDYLVLVAGAAVCGGSPSAGTASGPAEVCASSPFTLSLNGYDLSSGNSIQWQSSPAGAGTWTNVGTNSAMLSVTGGIASATDYQAIVTCSNGGGSSTSNIVTVDLKPFYICYCGPNTGVTLNNLIINYILNVNIPNTTLNNTSITTVGGYSLFYPTTGTTTADLVQGQQYTLNVTHYAANYYSSVWIDYDGNGVFDASEYFPVPATGTAATTTFTVPLTATPGLTGMRVRHYFTQYTSGQACSPGLDYETEDYVVNILAAGTCTGTPTAGTISGAATACSNVPFSLSLNGYTTAQGISFLWESSPAGANTWTPMAPTTSTITGVSQTSATDYRVTVTCANGGGSDISAVYTVNMSPFYVCYCSPLTGVALDGVNTFNYITNVTIPGTSLSSPTNTGGYHQYYPTTINTTADLTQGVQYTLNTTHAFSGTPYTSFAWIDFDANGTFDASEYILLTTTGLNGSATFSVPLTAVPGLTGLRIRHYFGTINAADACSVNGSYETEDYVINILATTPCSGTPVAGIASGPANACAGVAFSLSLSGYTIGTGITIDWQSSPAGAGTWTSIGQTNPMATGITQTASTDYMAVVTCNGGAFSNSNVVTVTQNAPNQCYCTPTYTTGTGSGDYCTLVQLGTINNPTGASPSPYYTYYSSMSTDLTQGLNYTLTLAVGTYTNNDVAAWIDYNADGIFDAGEKLGEVDGLGAGGSTTINFTVPATAPAGVTRLRVREADQGTAGGMLPCDPPVLPFGETEDYNINILAATGCNPPSGLSASNITTTTADVSWGAVGTAVGYEWAVDQSNTSAPGGSTTVNSVLTNATQPVSGLSGSGTYYLHVRTDCGAGPGFSPWTLYSFSTSPVNDDCASAISISNGVLFNGTTASANQSMAACDFTVTANDVWYTVTTGPTSGAVTISVVTTGAMDIVLQTLDGTCGAFTPLAPTSSSTPGTAPCIDGPAAGTEFGVYNMSANTTYYVRVYGFNGAQGSFTIQASGSPLAIKLQSITATNIGSHNRVDWTTGEETTGDHFLVQRSMDGIIYSDLGDVSAKGQPASYSYLDQTPVTGVNYYRLKIMEPSGAYSYSGTVTAIMNKGTFQVEAFPNPVANVVTVRVHGIAGANASITVSDLTGKILKSVPADMNEIRIGMGDLAAGSYFIKYADDRQSQVIKITKQ